MPFNIDSKGWITGASDIRTMPRPEIEHGALRSIKGIIVHQTDSDNAAGTLQAYQRKGSNGAHFLIDKDGAIYQVASLLKKTWHVGILKSRCISAH